MVLCSIPPRKSIQKVHVNKKMSSQTKEVKRFLYSIYNYLMSDKLKGAEIVF